MRKDVPSYHYVYVVYREDTHQFYFGARTCKFFIPEEDDYMGSGSWVKSCMAWKIPLKKEVLKIFSSHSSMRDMEKKLIHAFDHNPLLMNIDNRKKDGKYYPKFKSVKNPNGCGLFINRFEHHPGWNSGAGNA